MVMANIVLFLWEYHSGALRPDEEWRHSTANGLEPILLVREVQQQLEDKALWQAAAVRERRPFVSDYFRGLVAQGILEADAYRFLTHNGPIEVPWSLIVAETEIATKAIPSKPLARATQIADAGEASTSVTVQEQGKVLRHVSIEHETEAQPKERPPAAVEPVAKQEKSAVTTSRASGGTVALAHEQSDLGRPEKLVQEDSPKTAESRLCYEVGPFDNVKHFNKWRRFVGMDSKLITQVEREEREITGYLVYYPAPATFEEARANAEMLKNKGITDLWLFRKGESKGEISLGLFRNKARAEVLQQQLSARDLDVMIKPRYKITNKLYGKISISQESEDQLTSSLEQWRQRNPEFAVELDSSCVAEPDVTKN